MELLRNTRQEDDPHGLRAVGDLLQFAVDDNYEARIRANLPAISRARGLLERTRRLVPGVEFSPHVTRVLTIAEKVESVRLAEVA